MAAAWVRPGGTVALTVAATVVGTAVGDTVTPGASDSPQATITRAMPNAASVIRTFLIRRAVTSI